MAALPDVIGSTIGNIIAFGVASTREMNPAVDPIVEEGEPQAASTTVSAEDRAELADNVVPTAQSRDVQATAAEMLRRREITNEDILAARQAVQEVLRGAAMRGAASPELADTVFLRVLRTRAADRVELGYAPASDGRALS